MENGYAAVNVYLLKIMDVRQYLERVKVFHIEELSFSFLKKLQRQHLFTVPFENFDILRGVKIVLDEKRIYEKIVIGNRGGFCYELNGLFCRLLRNLGFSVSMVSGRVYFSKEDKFSPEFDHMVLLVHIDQTYLVDVGFGDSCREPIPMPDGVVEDIGARYRIQPQQPDGDRYHLQKKVEGGWRPVYSFTEHPRKMSDFDKMCVFNQTSPDSHFTKRTICTIATARGMVMLSDHSLTITRGNEVIKIDATSHNLRKRMLREHFGIDLKDK
jgi:N-hydroxyarylamine O-acetyltransferase